MKAVHFLRDKLAGICKVMSVIFLAYCCGIIVLEVILRFGFGSGIVWSGASARYAVIWSVMLMASVLIRDDDLIRADFFDSFLPKSFLKVRDIIYQIVTACIFLLLTYYGYKFALNGQSLNITYTNISIFWAYLAVPVGAALMMLQFVLNIIIKANELFFGDKNHKQPDAAEDAAAVAVSMTSGGEK